MAKRDLWKGGTYGKEGFPHQPNHSLDKPRELKQERDVRSSQGRASGFPEIPMGTAIELCPPRVTTKPPSSTGMGIPNLRLLLAWQQQGWEKPCFSLPRSPQETGSKQTQTHSNSGVLPHPPVATGHWGSSAEGSMTAWSSSPQGSLGTGTPKELLAPS